MASIFVTGATGYLGAVACEKLIAAGYDVTGLARSPEAAAKLVDAGVRPVHGALGDAALLAAAARSADAVLHAAADWGPGFAASDRAAVEAMLDALTGSAKPFVYTSGTWVMGGTGGRLAGEMFPLNGPPLVAWRPAVERLVLDSAEKKVRGVVLRPAMVFGRGGGTAGKIARGELPVVGDGSNHWSFVNVDDLGDLYVLATERGRSGCVYLAADGPPVKTADLAAALGAAPPVPLEQARERFGPVAECWALDQKIGSTRAFRELGWRPTRPTVLQEGKRCGLRSTAPH